MGGSEGPDFRTAVVIPVQFRPAATHDLMEAVDWYEAQRSRAVVGYGADDA